MRNSRPVLVKSNEMSSPQTIDPLSERPERDAGVPHYAVVCIRCGGAVRPGRLRCAQCSSDEAALDSAADRGAMRVPPLAKSSSPNQFSIESLLLVTTLVGVCLGLCAAFPPVGLLVSCIALAALVRTIIAGRQYVRAGVPFPAREKFETFVVSLLIVLYALGFSVLVLLSLCFFASMAADLLSFVLAAITWVIVLVAPLTVGIWFLWATRPQ